MRRKIQFKKAEGHGIHLPPDLKGMMLSEGCTLTEQGEQNLRTLTAGDQSYDAIKAALVKLSTGGSKLLSKGKEV